MGTVQRQPSDSKALPQHRKLILEDSAVSLAVARERGYRSVQSSSSPSLAPFNSLPSRFRTAPGLLIPLHDVNGKVPFALYRPDSPALDRRGKPAKYLRPQGSPNVLDVPPRCRMALADVAEPLWVTEGVRKADSAATVGLCVVCVLGVRCWHAKGGRPLAAWNEIPLVWREVFLAFDSDCATNPNVARALDKLAVFLRSRGAFVKVVVLPGGGEGEKIGLDDYLASGGTVEKLYELAGKVPDAPLSQVPR